MLSSETNFRTRLRTNLGAYLGAAALAAIATSAVAADPGFDDAQRRAALRAGIGACLSDRLRLCPEVEPGQGRIIACLVAHADQLDPVCAGAMEKASDALMSAARAIRPSPMVKTSNQ